MCPYPFMKEIGVAGVAIYEVISEEYISIGMRFFEEIQSKTMKTCA